MSEGMFSDFAADKVSKKVNSLFYGGSPIGFANLPWGPQQNNIHTNTYNALFKTMIKR